MNPAVAKAKAITIDVRPGQVKRLNEKGRSGMTLLSSVPPMLVDSRIGGVVYCFTYK